MKKNKKLLKVDDDKKSGQPEKDKRESEDLDDFIFREESHKRSEK
ncbi:MAG: hypothetical protein QME45_04100 [Clostridiales bacterium]|nr:hypothetical protein [Clostridiales bacterium]